MNHQGRKRLADLEWQTYQRLLAFARPYLGRLLLGFGFGLLYAAANGGILWAVKGGFARVFDPRPGGTPVAQVILFAALFPLVGLLRGIGDFASKYYIRWVGNRVVMDLRNAIYVHLNELSVGYFTHQRTGDLMSRVSNDTTMAEGAVSNVVEDLAKEPVTLIVMIGSLFWLDPLLAAASLVLFPVCILPVAMFGRRVRQYTREAQQKVGDLVTILQETLSGVRVVKAFGMEPWEVERFRQKNAQFFNRLMRVARANVAVEPLIVFISTLGMSLVLIYVRAVHMTVDEFVTFTGALIMMYTPVKKLSRVHLNIQQASAAADRIFEVLDTPVEVCEQPSAVPFEDAIRTIAFEHVGFAYRSGEPVLEDIHFEVRAGQRIAFVGSSGAGKTTLVNLLPRFFDVTAGRVTLNGRDVREFTLRSLRKQMGLVTQETVLFNATVGQNIAYGSLEATPAEIEAAAQRAHADPFIRQLPEGYETLIGEHGARLSGGQRQRIAIARALLRNPPLLILDEATSALDTESERLVQAALQDLMAGRTVFAIAHRLSTIASCDRIVVLDKGRIVESGTHAELLDQGGFYRRLYNLQFETPASASDADATAPG